MAFWNRREDVPPPTEVAKANTGEIGTTGLQMYGGRVHEEFHPALRGDKARKVYREMADNDPVVGAILFAMDMLIRQVTWHTEPADDSPAALQVADDVWTSLHDMSQTWANVLSEIMSMLTYGWSYHELVYKIRRGPEAAVPSTYDDGMVGWRKMPGRAQDTLSRWEWDPAGGIAGMYQLDMSAIGKGEVFIPIEKSLLFRTTAQKNNPEGKSVLRTAYRSWYMKKRIEEIEAIGIERDLAGLPVAWVPPTMLSKDATTDEKAALEEIKKIVKRVKRDEQEGVVFPLTYDAKGNKLYDLTLLTSGGQRQFSPDEIITRYDQRMAMTVLGDFILLGHEKVGSFALGSTKMDLFAVALGAWLDEIADVFNQYAIPRLCRLNACPVDIAPKLRHSEVKNVNLKELGDYITSLAGVGFQLYDDASLEEYLRGAAQLPRREYAQQVDAPDERPEPSAHEPNPPDEDTAE